MSTYRNGYKGHENPKPNTEAIPNTPAAKKADGRKRPVTVICLEREERIEISRDEYVGLVANSALLKAVERMVRSGESINRLTLAAVLGIVGKEGARHEDHA
jgi:hypothetical protein